MTRTAFFGFSAVVLLILNIGLTIFLFTGKGEQERKRPHHPGPRNEIITQLNLDEKQVAAYDALIKEHRSNIHAYDGQMMHLKKELYTGLASDMQLDEQDSLLQAISVIQLQIEQVHYVHFQAIRALCRPDQQANFDELANRLAALFAPPKPPVK